ELSPVPAGRLQVSEVDDGAEPHAALRPLAPHEGVVDAPIGTAQEVAALHALLVEAALAGDVGVDPEAVVEALLVELRHQARGLGKTLGIPLEVAPHERALPEGVEVEDVAGNAFPAEPPRVRQHRGLGELHEAGG